MFITDRAYIITRRGYRLKEFGQLKGNFVKIPNELLRDNNLSWKAKGLYCWMASHDDSFTFTTKSIARDYPDGRTLILAAMQELRDSGWMVYIKKANGYGKYNLTTSIKAKSDNRTLEQTIIAEPQSEKQTMAEKPKSDNPELGFPTVGKPNRINNTNSLNNTNVYKGDAEKSGEKNSKHVQDASIALSYAMDIDQIILKQTGGNVNVKH